MRTTTTFPPSLFLAATNCSSHRGKNAVWLAGGKDCLPLLECAKIPPVLGIDVSFPFFCEQTPRSPSLINLGSPKRKKEK